MRAASRVRVSNRNTQRLSLQKSCRGNDPAFHHYLTTGSLNNFCFYDRQKKTMPDDAYVHLLWTLCIWNTEDRETNEIHILEIPKCAKDLPVSRFRINLRKKRMWIPMWRLFDCFAQNLLDCDKKWVEFRCGADPLSLLPLNSLGINGKEGGGMMIRAKFILINSR